MASKPKKGSKEAQARSQRNKSAKGKASKAAKKPKSKKADVALAENAGTARIGHNSDGTVNVALQEALARIVSIRKNKKELGKAERDEIARIKSEFNISSAVVKHELRLQQMDSDVRAQFEHGHSDLKGMLGIQLALPLEESEEVEAGEGADEYGNPIDGQPEEDGRDAEEDAA